MKHKPIYYIIINLWLRCTWLYKRLNIRYSQGYFIVFRCFKNMLHDLAQEVEQLSCNRKAASSIPTSSCVDVSKALNPNCSWRACCHLAWLTLPTLSGVSMCVLTDVSHFGKKRLLNALIVILTSVCKVGRREIKKWYTHCHYRYSKETWMTLQFSTRAGRCRS